MQFCVRVRIVRLRAISKTELQNADLLEVPSPREERQEAKRAYTSPVKQLRDIWDWVLCGALLCGLAALICLSVDNHLLQPLWAEAETHRWMRWILRPSMFWTAMGLVLLGFRTVLWSRYRPFSSASMENAPWLTVIIPAYNEGPMVLKSIESVAMAHYPRDRLEIFVVDDGSTDDTWHFIRRAADRYRQFVKPIRLRDNCGKRAALAVAFRKARGTVVVTLDSDSVVEPDSLLAIAGAFRDPKIGAVAGKVAVYNRQGFIPRMLHVQFVLSFDLQRAVESTYGNVYCCPGALTAYRTSVVQNVLDDWMEQTFLGSPCTIGEDRAMTNLILESGYDTVYQRSAIVHTVVPATYFKLCKMFIRWNRSYVREELRFLTIVWKRPLKTRVIALCDRIITNLRYPVHYASLFLLALLVMHHPWMLARILVAIGVISLFNMTYYLRSERSPDFCYGVLYSYFALGALSWIFPYAAFTVRARSWLTR
jgi:hyaluronan synthase